MASRLPNLAGLSLRAAPTNEFWAITPEDARKYWEDMQDASCPKGKADKGLVHEDEKEFNVRRIRDPCGIDDDNGLPFNDATKTFRVAKVRGNPARGFNWHDPAVLARWVRQQYEERRRPVTDPLGVPMSRIDVQLLRNKYFPGVPYYDPEPQEPMDVNTAEEVDPDRQERSALFDQEHWYWQEEVAVANDIPHISVGNNAMLNRLSNEAEMWELNLRNARIHYPDDAMKLRMLYVSSVRARERFEETERLWHAITTGDTRQIIDALTPLNVDPNVTSHGKTTALHVAAKTNSQELVLLLLKEKGFRDMNARNYRGNRPLHLAAMYNAVDAGNALLQNGATVEVRNEVNHTPLTVAAIFDAGAMINVLISNGASLSGPELPADPFQFKPLHFAVDMGRGDAVRRLLMHGGNLPDNGSSVVHARTGLTQSTPLHLACQAPSSAPSKTEVVRALLAVGADVGLKDFVGNTPLHYAVRISYSDARRSVVHLLLRSGADPEVENDLSQSPRNLAVAARYTATVRQMEEHASTAEEHQSRRPRISASAGLAVV